MLYIDITRLYNNQRLGKTATGVDKVSLAYIAEFQNSANALIRLPKHWLFFSRPKSKKIFKKLLENNSIHLPKGIFRHFYSKPVKEGQNFLLNTAHSGLENAEFSANMVKYNLKGIYFLHDLIPIDYPEFCRVGESDKHHRRLKNMISGELIICNSQYTQGRFENYCEQYNFIKPKTIWAHLAVGTTDSAFNPLKHSVRVKKSINIPKNFFLVLGTIEGRKNHILLLNIWRELKRVLGKQCPTLVIIGKRGWECEQVLSILDRSVELRDVIIELNDCEDGLLSYLMQNTRALLFPSLVEGFGLPLLEALQAKIPVIASDIEVFRELSFSTVKLISPYDSKSWIEAIIEYSRTDSVIRPYQVEKIRQIQPLLPSWNEHFDKVTPMIQSIVNMK